MKNVIVIFLITLFITSCTNLKEGACVDDANNRCKEVNEGKCNTSKGLVFHDSKTCSDFGLSNDGDTAFW